jgi:hypothetical protein
MLSTDLFSSSSFPTQMIRAVTVDLEEALHKIDRIQATGYMAVAAATLIFYDYILTFKHEGELCFLFYER